MINRYTKKVKRNLFNVFYSTLIHIILTVPYLLIIYHRVCNKSNTTGATSGAETAYPSGAPEFTSGFIVGFVFLNLQFFV